ncbi:hypothetical protein H632_c1786p0, partial [Helicosporidium sp. ATCC 50920]
SSSVLALGCRDHPSDPSTMDAAQFADWQEQAAQAFHQVTQEIKDKIKTINGDSPGVIESFKSFLAAVDWTEPWIRGILASHAILLLTVFLFKSRTIVQGVVFFLAFVSAPLLFIMFVVLIFYMIACTSALIRMKRRELAYKARQRARTEGKKEK